MRRLSVSGILAFSVVLLSVVLFSPLRGQVPTLIPSPWNGTTVYPFFAFFVGGGPSLPGGSDQWSDFGGESQSATAPAQGAGYSQVVVPSVFDRLTVSINSAQPATGTLVCSLYSGTDGAGADTALTVTFLANAAAGTVVQDLTHSYVAAMNSKLSVHCKNNALTDSGRAGTLSVRVH